MAAPNRASFSQRLYSAGAYCASSCTRNQHTGVRIGHSLFDGVQRGVVIAEGVWPNAAHERGEGINVLTGADAAAPCGGAAFHDNRVWVRAA